MFNYSRQVLGADSCESPPPSIRIQSWLLRSKGGAALKLGAKRLGCCYSCPTRLRLVCQAAEAADSLKGDQTEVLELVLFAILLFAILLDIASQDSKPFPVKKLRDKSSPRQ